MAVRIVFEESPTLAEISILESGIASDGRTKVGEWGHESIAFFLRDQDDAIVGGVYGNTGFGWLYISDLWVAEQLRGKGYGVQLMQLAEGEALRRGCKNVYLNTFSFQAPRFYQDLGYKIFAELEQFPPGHSRFFLRKQLSS